MADDSAKEQVNAGTEEKEQDTALAVAADVTSKAGSRPTSKSGSKPGSAKSGGTPKSGRPKSPKSPKSGRSDKSAKSKSAKSKKGSAKADESTPTTDLTPDLQAKIDNFKIPDELPEGAKSLFLSSKTQELFNLEGASAEKPIVMIPKETIIQDTIKRAAVSDFSPIKKKIQEYPEEYVFIIADVDYKFGENFVILLSVEAKDALLIAPEVEAGEEGEDEDLEPVVYKYIPPVPKDWVSQGSENEVKEESMGTNRPLLTQNVVRVREHFGAPVVFKDRNVSDARDAYIECTPYDDPSYDITTVERDTATQAIPETFEVSCQTDWKYPKNANTQYYYREFSEEQKEEELKKENLSSFMTDVRPRFEEALQQNEIMNVFFDDWNALSSEDNAFGNKADSHLKEFQSFTDLLFSKEKTITCIDWHPTIKGLVAVSVAQKMTFDQRVDNAQKIIMTPSLILIWSFVDPIHPLLLLEAPDDIYTFKFCPTDANVVAGGCLNGQVVMWDLSAHSERLKNQRSSKQEKKKNTLNTLPGYADENPMETPIVRYSAVSSIENSHKAAITDMLWIPDHMELNRMGVAVESRLNQCIQIMTAAADHSVLVWDTRPPSKVDHHKKTSDHSNMKNQSVFKHLDLVWKPLMKVYLSKSEPGGDHNPTLFSISEVQGDRSVVGRGSDELKESTNMAAGQFSMGVSKPTSGKDKKTLTGVNTHMYCGTEDGDLVYVDWMPQKDQDSGKIQTPKPDFYHGCHDGRVVCLQRSPFFKDILLVVGGWTFSIWKEGVNSGPIIKSPTSKRQLSSGFWSPSRPGVFYIAREDGSVDIWDLLEKTHEPSMNQNVSAHPITCIYPFSITHRQHLLAVGDNSGTLHVMEIPWSLRHASSGELQGVKAYLDREVARRQFVVSRWNFREEEKREIEAEHKRKMGIAPNVQLSDEEKEMRDKNEYNAFQEDEKNFLRQLGILKEEEEILLPPE